MGAAVGAAIAGHVGTEAGRAGDTRGAGGDITVEVDRLAEQAVFAELERLAAAGERFSVLSEETGEVDHGAEFPRVVVDPVDGSLNAKNNIPCYGAMFTLLTGPTVADITAGYVVNLATGERWAALRGEGGFRNGQRIQPLPPVRPGKLDTVALESSPRSIYEAEKLLRAAGKLRILGSMAISMAITAAGAVDVFCSPMRSRVFDLTASALLIEETGGVVTDMAGHSLADLRVGLAVRSTVLASAHPAAHQLALQLLTG